MKKILNKKRIIMALSLLLIVALAGYFYVNRGVQPKVVSTNPGDKAAGVVETSQISINFDQSIQEGSKSKISVTLDPKINFDSTWLSDTYKIVPKQNLQNNIDYKVSVFFDKKEIYNFSFKTSAFNQKEAQTYGGQQAQNDYVFGQAVNDFEKKNPWFQKLPIRTSDYTIYYDGIQKEFSIAFIGQNLTQEEQQKLIPQAVDDLKKIGVPEPIKYYIYQP